MTFGHLLMVTFCGLALSSFGDYETAEITLTPFYEEEGGMGAVFARAAKQSAIMNTMPKVKRVERKACVFKSYSEQYVESQRVGKLFMERKFEELNQTLDKYNGMVDVGGRSYMQELSRFIRARFGGFEIAREWNCGKFNSGFSEAIMADYYISRAWFSRTNSLAKNVTKQGWKLFRKYITKAREHAMLSFKKNPSLSLGISPLLHCLGSSGGSDNSSLYLWTNLALEIEPWNLEAVASAYHFLQPKWGGSFEALKQIDRELAAVDQSFAPTDLLKYKFFRSVRGIYDCSGASREQWRAVNRDCFDSTEEAIRQGLIAKFPKRVVYWETLLKAAIYFKYWDDFDRIFEEAVKLFPNEYLLYFQKNEKMKIVQAGDYEERLKNLKKAESVFANDGLIFYELAMIGKKKPELMPKADRDAYLVHAEKLLNNSMNVQKTKLLKFELLIQDKKYAEADAYIKSIPPYSITKQEFSEKIALFYADKSYGFLNMERAWQFYMLNWTLRYTEELDTDVLAQSGLAGPDNCKEWVRMGDTFYDDYTDDYKGAYELLKQHYEKAETFVIEATDASVKSDFYYEKGRVHFFINSTKEAFKAFEKSVSFKETFNNCSFYARAAQRLKKHDVMNEYFEKCWQFSKDDENLSSYRSYVARAYANVLLSQKKYNKVMQVTEKILSSKYLDNFDNTDCLCLKAAVSLYRKEYETTETLLNEANEMCEYKYLRKKIKRLQNKLKKAKKN